MLQCRVRVQGLWLRALPQLRARRQALGQQRACRSERVGGLGESALLLSQWLPSPDTENTPQAPEWFGLVFRRGFGWDCFRRRDLAFQDGPGTRVACSGFSSSVLNSVRYYGLCGSVVGPEALQGGGQQDECLFAGKVVACEVGGLLAVHDSWARGGSADEAAFHLPAQQGPCVCCSALRWQSALLVERGETRGARWHVLYGACVLFAAEPGCQARDNPRPCPLHSEMGPMRRRGGFVLARARILTACLLTHAPRTHLPA